ncbi:glycosyltransferase family 2 protein [Ensifer adhaerens]|uniref:glycosyltransferase family 2 protein n=1 Tax=Ensifer adhaerens TaxID=106592 RepID=UPI000FDCC984|nr:glycosyltransferase family 2 protein [Ensifer adhaerens]MDF8358673.1 glycosyltransferase family 2 protein [Ensifer adhaerens]THA59496.1 glycosyltransferase [Ensifer adhaerens]
MALSEKLDTVFDWKMMKEVGRAEFGVSLADAADRYADRPIMVSVHDPDHRLGLRPQLLFKRRDRTPATVFRSFLIGQTGRGRFYGWTPVQLDAIALAADAETANDAARIQPRIRLRRLSLIEVAGLIACRRILAFLQIIRLFLAGNKKGAAFRFVRQCDALSAPNYADWVEAQAHAEQGEVRNDVRVSQGRLRVLVSIEGGDAIAAEESRESLNAQSWRGFREASAADVAKSLKCNKADSDVLWMRLPAGMRLAERALERLVEPFAFSEDVTLCYSDEDCVNVRGERFAPFFKPAWNAPLARSGWLPLEGAVIRLSRIPTSVAVESASTAEIALAVAQARTGDILHLPRVLLHRGPSCYLPQTRAKCAQPKHLRPAVSVIIPTRDRADLLEACLKGLFENTAPADLDVIVIDNESSEPATLALFSLYEQSGRIRRISLPGGFNFARACNIGVDAAKHDLILLLNNDVEPIDCHWLECLAGELDDQTVGAAGNLLLFPDGFVQHGGVTLGAGTVARHTFHFLDPKDGGDRGLLSQRRDLSAVTAACLLTRKDLWRRLGGMEEQKLTVAFNDVDYCLKLREAGFRIVWTPEAAMLHRESVSRGADDTPQKLQRFAREERIMHERWSEKLKADPYYNPNLSLIAEEFVLEARPRNLWPRSNE